MGSSVPARYGFHIVSLGSLAVVVGALIGLAVLLIAAGLLVRRERNQAKQQAVMLGAIAEFERARGITEVNQDLASGGVDKDLRARRPQGPAGGGDRGTCANYRTWSTIPLACLDELDENNVGTWWSRLFATLRRERRGVGYDFRL